MATATKPKIGAAEYKKFLATLPEDVQREVYRFFSIEFSIPRALFVIQKFGIEAQTIDRIQIEKAAKQAGVDYPLPEPGQISFSLNDRSLNDGWIGQLVGNPETAEYPLKKDPIIYLQTDIGRGKDKRTTWFLIDGGHRLRMSYLRGDESLKVIAIPKEYSHLIKV